MWTRKELKQKGKAALSRNYWKAVLVSLILIILSGGIRSSAAAFGSGSRNEEISSETTDTSLLETGLLPVVDVGMDEPVTTAGEIAEHVSDKVEKNVLETLETLQQMNVAVYVAFAVVVIVMLLIIVTVFLLADAFIVNPLCVGASRFLLKSVDDTGNVAELGYTFDHNYKNGVKTTFMRDIRIFLWALLFVIPGIYKKYQYYMVDYILAENPDMPYQEVLARSKKMMDGQKWNTFVLDLSFILWHMLGAVTCGLTDIFYTRPYLNLTRASLYRTLCERTQNMTAQNE